MIAEPPRAAAPPTLYPFQKEAIFETMRDLGRGSKGFYVQHDPGMGKSLTGILIARLLDARRVLVVTTKAGLGVWRHEVAKWWPNGNWYVTVINYDALSESFVQQTVENKQELLILDEAHYAKNSKSNRGRACAKLARAARHTLLLSGTPAHSPLDYHHQYKLIAPDEWPWTLKPSAYKQMICNLDGPFGTWLNKHRPYKLDEVAKVERVMARHTHKATKDELRLPEPIETVVPIQLDAKERSTYREMEKRLLVELPPDAMADAPIVLTKILRLQQITSGFLKDTEGVEHAVGTSKLDVAVELITERYGAGQKIVVACRFGHEIAALVKRLAGLTVYVIDGSTSDRTRTGYVEQFQQMRNPAVMVLQYQAGGTSITLTAADCMIFLSMTPSVIEWEQIKARIHRIGTTTHVQYLYLLADGSVDETLFEGLKGKADLVRLTSLLRSRLNGR